MQIKHIVIFLLTLCLTDFYVFGQPANNNCGAALELCPGVPISADNFGANSTVCPGCEDDFAFCFQPNNTIWFTFTTNAVGGSVQIDFTNLLFENNPGQDNEIQASILEAGVPCNAGTYTQLGNCVSNASTNFSLNATGLAPSTVYYVVVDGDDTGAGITSAAAFSFDILLSGAGVERVPPDISVSTASLSVCQDDLITFIASLNNCPDSSLFRWYLNDTLIAVTNAPEFQTTALTNGGVISVAVDCFSQCIETAYDTLPPISVHTFDLDAGPDVSVLPGETVTLTGTTSAPVYNWSPAYLFSSPNSLVTLATPTETVTITLSATENGCTRYDYLTIFVVSGIEIPNTFSPNGDNINDTWVIKGLEIYPDNFVSIYDRWGQLVFQTSGYSSTKTWDGTTRNSKANEGVYFYVIDPNKEGEAILKGTLTLIR